MDILKNTKYFLLGLAISSPFVSCEDDEETGSSITNATLAYLGTEETGDDYTAVITEPTSSANGTVKFTIPYSDHQGALDKGDGTLDSDGSGASVSVAVDFDELVLKTLELSSGASSTPAVADKVDFFKDETANDADDGELQAVEYTVKAEDGSESKYDVSIMLAEVSTDAELTKITLTDESGNSFTSGTDAATQIVIGEEDATSATDGTIPAGTLTYGENITVVCEVSSYATIADTNAVLVDTDANTVFDDVTPTAQTADLTFEIPVNGLAQNGVLKVIVTAENGTTLGTYTMTVQ